MTLISHDRNDFQIFFNSKETFSDLIDKYVNLECIYQLNSKL